MAEDIFSTEVFGCGSRHCVLHALANGEDRRCTCVPPVGQALNAMERAILLSWIEHTRKSISHLVQENKKLTLELEKK